MRKIGRDSLVTSSAGASPWGQVSPHALRVLREIDKLDPTEARSKAATEFPEVPFDFVITVCIRARESSLTKTPPHENDPYWHQWFRPHRPSLAPRRLELAGIRMGGHQ